MLFERAGPGADYEELHVVQDRGSGLRAVVAIHSTRRGPAAGGIRRATYANEEAAVADALALASAMTAKCALADLPAGGAKTVILDHASLDRSAAYRALGRAIERLGGRYLSGPDVGTGEAELADVRRETRHVNPEGNDANAATAAGVLAGIRGLLRAMDGAADARGKTFVVQGLGGVGGALARALLADGATVVGADVRAEARDAAAKLGARIVDPALATATPCDVFVPCALGGVLTAEVAARIPARGICGSANNPLSSVEAGRILHARGVRYAPDFLVNAGAVIEGVLTTRDGATDAVRAKARAHIARIEGTTERILRASIDEDAPPHEVAMREAAARLA